MRCKHGKLKHKVGRRVCRKAGRRSSKRSRRSGRGRRVARGAALFGGGTAALVGVAAAGWLFSKYVLDAPPPVPEP